MSSCSRLESTGWTGHHAVLTSILLSMFETSWTKDCGAAIQLPGVVSTCMFQMLQAEWQTLCQIIFTALTNSMGSRFVECRTNNGGYTHYWTEMWLLKLLLVKLNYCVKWHFHPYPLWSTVSQNWLNPLEWKIVYWLIMNVIIKMFTKFYRLGLFGLCECKRSKTFCA